MKLCCCGVLEYLRKAPTNKLYYYYYTHTALHSHNCVFVYRVYV